MASETLASAPPHRLLAERGAANPQYRQSLDPRIKAAIAIGPWGMQGGFWDADGLSGIRTPVLFVAGSADDVSGYEKGTRAIFQGAVNADRYLLTFLQRESQRGGALSRRRSRSPPPASSAAFSHYADPVWDTARMNNILQHFATAHFDRYLKGDAAKAGYFDLVPQRQGRRLRDGSRRQDAADAHLLEGLQARHGGGIGDGARRADSNGSRQTAAGRAKTQDSSLKPQDLPRPRSYQRSSASSSASVSSGTVRRSSATRSSTMLAMIGVASVRRCASRLAAVMPSRSSVSSIVGNGTPGALPPPDRGRSADERRPPSIRRQPIAQGARACGDLVHAERQHPVHRHRLGRASGEVLQQRGLERRVGQLVHAERAHQGMATQLVDQRLASGEDAGLRAAEQLVAAEAHEIDAGGERRAHRSARPRTPSSRLPLPRSSTTGMPSDRPASTSVAQLGRSVKPSMRKFEGCTRRISAVSGRRRRGVIGDARAVRGADLAQDGAGLRHDVGHAEAAADLDQLAARDDHLASARRVRQHQQRRRGVVVHDHRGLGAGQRRQQRFGVHGPRAARAPGEVVLEVRVAAGGVAQCARLRPAAAARDRDSCARPRRSR